MKVNIKLNELSSVLNKSVNCKDEIKGLFIETNNLLTEINNIVKCEQLIGATSSLKANIEVVNNKMVESLDNINMFLGAQISSYSLANEKATNAINDLSSVIGSGLGNGNGGIL